MLLFAVGSDRSHRDIFFQNAYSFCFNSTSRSRLHPSPPLTSFVLYAELASRLARAAVCAGRSACANVRAHARPLQGRKNQRRIETTKSALCFSRRFEVITRLGVMGSGNHADERYFETGKAYIDSIHNNRRTFAREWEFLVDHP